MADPGTLLAVVGPTAAGKSALALDLAESLGGDIVNADAMAVYRGMDIGTAKTPVAERRGIPHHVLDCWEPTYPANVAEYQALALAAIEQIRSRGRMPILVGGSGLYVRCVIDEFEFPGHDPQIRQRWERELSQRGPAALHAELARRDPAAASAILPTNGRRIVRALEVVDITGSFTATLPDAPQRRFRTLVIGLAAPRDELDESIADRVDRMWRDGLVDEVRRLDREAGLSAGPTASRALGYRQVLDLLAGRCDEPEAQSATVRATKKFARRQLSWFRRDPAIVWLPAYQASTAHRAQEAAQSFLHTVDA